jgi:hypothetical protein
MKIYIVATILALTLNSFAGKKHIGSSLALPNPQLLGCNSASCERLWQGDYPEANAAYPTQLSIDLKGGVPYGLTARYDKSIPTLTIKTALVKVYAKWTMTGLSGSPVIMWRVETEKIVIQLSTTEEGARQLVYLSLRPELRR